MLGMEPRIRMIALLSAMGGKPVTILMFLDRVNRFQSGFEGNIYCYLCPCSRVLSSMNTNAINAVALIYSGE